MGSGFPVVGIRADSVYIISHILFLASIRYYSRLATGMYGASRYLEFQTDIRNLAIGRFHVNVASISPDPRCAGVPGSWHGDYSITNGSIAI